MNRLATWACLAILLAVAPGPSGCARTAPIRRGCPPRTQFAGRILCADRLPLGSGEALPLYYAVSGRDTLQLAVDSARLPALRAVLDSLAVGDSVMIRGSRSYTLIEVEGLSRIHR